MTNEELRAKIADAIQNAGNFRPKNKWGKAPDSYWHGYWWGVVSAYEEVRKQQEQQDTGVDMSQRPLEGYERIERDEKGNVTLIERYKFCRDAEGNRTEVRVAREEWAVIDGLNQRV